jgi:hypothetical protein
VVSAATSIAVFARPTIVVGQTDTVTLVLKDAAGNAVTGLDAEDFVPSLVGGTSNGTFGTLTATSKPGIYTVIFTATSPGTASQLEAEIAGVLIKTKAKLTVK